jgi:hypothetical protein
MIQALKQGVARAIAGSIAPRELSAEYIVPSFKDGLTVTGNKTHRLLEQPLQRLPDTYSHSRH